MLGGWAGGGLASALFPTKIEVWHYLLLVCKVLKLFGNLEKRFDPQKPPKILMEALLCVPTGLLVASLHPPDSPMDVYREGWMGEREMHVVP